MSVRSDRERQVAARRIVQRALQAMPRPELVELAGSLDCALVYTAGAGWQLEPSRALVALVAAAQAREDGGEL